MNIGKHIRYFLTHPAMVLACVGFALTIGVLLGCALYRHRCEGAFPIKEDEPVTETASLDPKETLSETARRIVTLCRDEKRVSAAAALWLQVEIVRVAEMCITKESARGLWVSQLCHESSFFWLAQSPTGPKGLGQMAAKAFQEGLAACGYPSAYDEERFHPGLNLIASAGYANTLFNQYSEPVALAAYVMGPNADALKKLSGISEEALTYSLRVQNTLIKKEN